MKVNNGNQGPVRPERPREPGAPHILPVGEGCKKAPSAVERLDRVEISDAGRARAARVHPVATDAADRLAQIRRRVLEGAYNADAVVADVARRILDRGDA
ncbi:MAG: flagellar biosynthesis anti-sigma factor FlgM [Gemmatimonadaceae bacterium]|nr:flagellar biosynthesis anti-sigma factor FlgM [Gemmatimonadaceae bacterium]